MMAMFALLSIFGSGAFLILLMLLHFLKPETSPSWRLISEYAIGRYGLLMRLAFWGLALGVLSFVVARVESGAGQFSLIALSAIGLVLIGAGYFVSNPITVADEDKTLTGKIHDFCGGIVIVGFPLTICFVKGNILPLTVLVWLGFLYFIGSVIFYLSKTKTFGPKAKVGLSNRLMMLTYALWLIVHAALLL